jgi:hypothetical protein
MPSSPKHPTRAGLNATKTLALLGLMIATVALTGCGNTATNATRIANTDLEASGSPFRWTSKSVKGGWIVRMTLLDLPNGPSQADAVLTKDTLSIITKTEAAAGRPAPEIEAIKPLKDGREVWVLKSSDQGIAYVISFKPSPLGGVDISMRGPQLYDRDHAK